MRRTTRDERTHQHVGGAERRIDRPSIMAARDLPDRIEPARPIDPPPLRLGGRASSMGELGERGRPPLVARYRHPPCLSGNFSGGFGGDY